ncbi:MAG: PKD domain-containing protein, partial [Candidatus Nanohaloarchaea archaeon]|nr:PKD domain-containing protein [Candidatus Nanohaloarchaea archaeon]
MDRNTGLKALAAFLIALIALMPVASAANLNSAFSKVESEGKTQQLEAEEKEAEEYSWYLNGELIEKSSEPSAEIDLPASGTHIVALRIKKDGEYSTTAKLVKTGKPPSAKFQYRQEGAGNLLRTGKEVVFDATASEDPDLDIESYSWKLDGEEIGTGEVLEHAFESDDAGLHSLKLIVTDSQGNTDSATTQLRVLASEDSEYKSKKPKARIGQDPSDPAKDETVVFDASDSFDTDNGIYLYRWYVNGDLKKGGPNATRSEVTFSSAGSYSVTLEVEDYNHDTSNVTKEVKITKESKVVDLEWSPKDPGAEKLVNFTGSVKNIEGKELTGLNWYVEDEKVASGSVSNPQIIFPESGLYRVRLEAVYGDGSTESEGETVNVTWSLDSANDRFQEVEVAPVARLNVDPERPDKGENVVLDGTDSIDPDGEISSFTIKVDNRFLGAQDLKEDTSFQLEGRHPVKLTVTDDSGISTTVSKNVLVGVKDKSGGQPPVVRLSVGPNNPKTSDVIVMDGSNSFDPDKDIKTHQWDVDDDGSYEYDLPKLAHSYDTAGSHKITFRVEDKAGRAVTKSKFIYVSKGVNDPENEDPKAEFGYSPSPVRVAQQINFDARSDSGMSSDPDGSISRYIWYIDGEKKADTSEPTLEHSFKKPGNHQVLLKVVDNGGDSDVKIEKLNVKSSTGEKTTTRVSGGDTPPIPGQLSSSKNQDLAYRIQKGWNMMSSPGIGGFQASVLASQCDLQKTQSGKVFSMEGGEAKKASIINPGKGYYIKTREECIVTVKARNLIKTEATEELEEGWNTISTPYVAPLEEVKGSCSFVEKEGDTVFRFAGGSWEKLGMDDKLQPFNGYLVKTKSSCKLSFGKCGTLKTARTSNNKAVMGFDEGNLCDGT